MASRKCVARLACEVQREYNTALEHYKDIKDRENSIYYNLEHRFMDLYDNNVLSIIFIEYAFYFPYGLIVNYFQGKKQHFE